MKTKFCLAIGCLTVLLFIGCRKGEVPIQSPEENPKEFKKPETQLVIGGQQTSINNAPYQVAIFIDGQFSGGGVLLNNEWILTAAHVITAFNTNTAFASNRITIRSGSSNLNSGGFISTVSSTIIHSGFPINNGYHVSNDIALVRLTAPLTFNANRSSIMYSVNEDPLYVNNEVTVSGWGRTSCSGTAASESLNRVNIRVDNLSTASLIKCKPFTGNQTAWKGDSGGPLVKNIPGLGAVLVGIVNSVTCNTGDGNYARVSHFADWIKTNTGIESPRMTGPAKAIFVSANYSISNLPSGATVSWSVSPSSAGTISGSGANVTLNRISSNYHNGLVTLSAQVSYSGSTISLSTLIYPSGGHVSVAHLDNNGHPYDGSGQFYIVLREQTSGEEFSFSDSDAANGSNIYVKAGTYTVRVYRFGSSGEYPCTLSTPYYETDALSSGGLVEFTNVQTSEDDAFAIYFPPDDDPYN